MRKLIVRTLVSLLPFAVQAVTLTVQADVQTVRATPDVNYASTATITVTPSDHALLRFSPSDAIQPGWEATIQRATLRLHISAVQGTGNILILSSTANWDEVAVTYNSEPLSSQSVAQVPIPTTAGDLEIPITTAIQKHLQNGTGPFSLQLHFIGATPDAKIVFDSKENTTTSRAPSLDVLLRGPVGPRGPIGSKGPQGPVGAQGTMGPRGGGIDFPEWERHSFDIPADSKPVLVLICRNDHTAVSGGCGLSDGDVFNADSGVQVIQSQRRPTSWLCQVKNDTTRSIQVQVAVLCTTSLQ